MCEQYTVHVENDKFCENKKCIRQENKRIKEAQIVDKNAAAKELERQAKE